MNFFNPKGNLFFTSDTHAFHKNICKGVTSWTGNLDRCRDFPDEVTMTEDMAKRINAKVGRNDTLIHLGDWSFGGKDKIKKFRDMLDVGTINLLLGNHDHHIEKNADEFQTTFFRVGKYNEFRSRGVLISCFHYPIGSWNEIGRGGIMLHGHCHGSYNVPGKILDVGMDVYPAPLHIDEIHDIIDKKELHLVDHHGEHTSYG